ncbi:MAG: sialidase family protein, partial [Silanimonas sp.]
MTLSSAVDATRACGAALLLASLLLAPPVLALRVTPIDWTPGAGSAQPSLTATPSGVFALTWQQKDGSDAELRVARFDTGAARPAAATTVARGGDWFVNWADFPSLAVLENGDWVTFTLRKSAGSTYAYDIHLQRSLDGGATWQAPVKVNDDGQAVQHGFVSLLPDGGDRVLLVWLDGRQDMAHDAHAPHAGHFEHGHGHDEGPMSLRSAVVSRDGVPREGAKLDADTCSCCQTDLVRRGGEVLTVYRDHAEGVRDIAVVRRGDDGHWQAPQAVNADDWRMPGCPVNGPAAAVNGDALAVAWPTMATGPLEVKLAISAREGAAFAPPVVIDVGYAVLGRVDVAPWRDGGFLISWVGGDTGSAVLHVAEVDAQGVVGERRDVVRLPPGRQLGHPRL